MINTSQLSVQGFESFQCVSNDSNKQYQCLSCGRYYKLKKNLVQHQRYECGTYVAVSLKNVRKWSFCQYELDNINYGLFGLFQLTETDMSKKFFCNLCGRSYKYKCHLKSHQRYECGREPQFACTYCPYRAKQKSALKTHIGLKHCK